MISAKARIEKNLHRIRENVGIACKHAGRSPDGVTIVAVTKSAGMNEIKAVVDLGVTDLGESRPQQLFDRSVELGQFLARQGNKAPSVRWHMVGHLQRNKVKQVIEAAGIIHSVDSLRLAEEINLRAERAGKVADVLLQVNCSGEVQKHGVGVGAAVHMAELVSSLKNVKLVGLMTMAPLVQDPENARPAFIRLREVFEEIRFEKIGGAGFRHLSMGMSQDYMIAVEEGATLLRIGSALFE